MIKKIQHAFALSERGAKDFVKYLSKASGIDFLTKAKQFVAEYDPETETLIVVVDEQHLK